MAECYIMKPIENYPNYLIDVNGNIFSLQTNKIIKTSNNGKGYITVHLYKDKKAKTFYVHRLVAQTYINNPLNLREVNHKDNIKHNNNVNNLEWVTSSENKYHSFKITNRKINKGEEIPKSVLTSQDVKEIKLLLEIGMLQKDIAKLFNVNTVTIGDIYRGRTWKHL